MAVRRGTEEGSVPGRTIPTGQVSFYVSLMIVITKPI